MNLPDQVLKIITPQARLPLTVFRTDGNWPPERLNYFRQILAFMAQVIRGTCQ
jgi:hypothetical protein